MWMLYCVPQGLRGCGWHLNMGLCHTQVGQALDLPEWPAPQCSSTHTFCLAPLPSVSRYKSLQCLPCSQHAYNTQFISSVTIRQIKEALIFTQWLRLHVLTFHHIARRTEVSHHPLLILYWLYGGMSEEIQKQTKVTNQTTKQRHCERCPLQI